jgi:aerobic-type carbon monoxide dehydrogenase small subunit (CoxS/CutS family)
MKKTRPKTSLDNESTGDQLGLNRLKMSRRTFMKASLAGAAVVGVGVTIGAKASGLGSAGQSSSGDPFALIPITLNVNNVNYSLSVEPRAMLVNVLRENLNLTGTKRPCNRMECGGCTVLVNNAPIYSCTYPAFRANGKPILTVEGTSVDNTLATVQAAWVDTDASQCGYCQPGRVMAATALLKNNPNPTIPQIQAGLEGVLCRCGTYINVIAAVQEAAKALGA